jgi:hypothetical protein
MSLKNWDEFESAAGGSGCYEGEIERVKNGKQDKVKISKVRWELTLYQDVVKAC